MNKTLSENTLSFKLEFPLCHRCRRPAPARGRMSAATTDSRGRVVTHYLCRHCCDALTRLDILVRHAETGRKVA